jgi:hypothetical protein
MMFFGDFENLISVPALAGSRVAREIEPSVS